jgi:uncharacterized protein with beta-barrel porin domain
MRRRADWLPGNVYQRYVHGLAVGDHLTAKFDAQSYSGRLEGGWDLRRGIAGIA